MATFQINPGADGVIEFGMMPDGGGEPVTTRLSPDEAQSLVDLLSVVRQMTPGSIAAEPAEGVVRAAVDPQWRSPPYRAPQGRVLILKHPGLGWLHFIFPEEQAAKVAQLLSLEMPPPPPAASLN